MHPIRTPLKIELGLAAAHARRGRARLVAAAAVLRINARRVVRVFVFMRNVEGYGLGGPEVASVLAAEATMKLGAWDGRVPQILHEPEAREVLRVHDADGLVLRVHDDEVVNPVAFEDVEDFVGERAGLDRDRLAR